MAAATELPSVPQMDVACWPCSKNTDVPEASS
jgi:hypothetical protein